MTTTEKLDFNFCIGMHNLNLVSEAKKYLRSFVDDGDGIVYIYNKDGTRIKLKPGFDIVAITGLGITEEEN